MIDWDKEHVTSNQNYALSNRLAGRSIQTVKQLFKNAKKIIPIHKFLFCIIVSFPKETYIFHQLLTSKSIRTKLPVTVNSLKPKLVKINYHQNKVKIKTDKMTEFYKKKKTKHLKPLTVGESVLFKLVVNGTWMKGKIVKKLINFLDPMFWIISSRKWE